MYLVLADVFEAGFNHPVMTGAVIVAALLIYWKWCR